jgi:hypothetical protein
MKQRQSKTYYMDSNGLTIRKAAWNKDIQSTNLLPADNR